MDTIPRNGRTAGNGPTRITRETALRNYSILPDRTTPDSTAHPRCSLCLDQQWLSNNNLNVGDPGFGEAIPCPQCLEPVLAAKRIGRLWGSAGLAPYAAMTFASFGPRNQERIARSDLDILARAKTICVSYAADPAGFIVLTGDNGLGKTHLAASIANHVAQTRPVAFLVVPDFLDHLRATFAPDSEVTFDQRFEDARNVFMLVMDDLGAQTNSEWAREKLFQLINHRCRMNLPTVYTTNRPLAAMDKRIASRLSDTRSGTVLKLTGPDIRGNLNRYQVSLLDTI